MPHPVREWQAVAGKAPSAPRFRPFFSACSTRLSRDLTATWEAGRPFLGVGFTYENARHIFVADNDEGSHSVMYVVRSLGLGTRSSVLRPVFFPTAMRLSALPSSNVQRDGRRRPEIHL